MFTTEVTESTEVHGEHGFWEKISVGTCVSSARVGEAAVLRRVWFGAGVVLVVRRSQKRGAILFLRE